MCLKKTDLFLVATNLVTATAREPIIMTYVFSRGFSDDVWTHVCDQERKLTGSWWEKRMATGQIDPAGNSFARTGGKQVSVLAYR